MVEFIFYSSKVTPLLTTVAGLVSKMYESGHKVFVLCKDEAQMNEFDTVLWVFSRDKFIPHDTTDSNIPELQPVLLGLDLHMNHNKSNVVVILNGKAIDSSTSFEKCVYVSNSADEAHALSQYADYKSKGHAVTLWQQNSDGKWLQSHKPISV
jgi:DNA polymerase-3 subunit chi